VPPNPAENVTGALAGVTISSMLPALPDRLLVQRLLAVMDQKNHWAFPTLTRPGLTRAQHLEHFKHEYLVYVRAFPELLRLALAQVPAIDDVRAALQENILEESTGQLSGSAPHAELFLRMMEGLGFARRDFDEDDAFLHPAARAYRDWLRAESASGPWQKAVALLTVWVEGSVNERAELSGQYVRPRGEDAVKKHALVVHYACPPAAMQLVRAHGDVEGSHRADAWRMVLAHVPDEGPIFDAVVGACQAGLARWHRYRDGVAERMGLARDRAA
jgi:pyrroloquinoline-quinone synthase